MVLEAEGGKRSRHKIEAEYSPCTRILLRIFSNPLFTFLCDWSPIVVFYAFGACAAATPKIFFIASAAGTVCGAFSMLCSFVHSMLDRRVAPIKVLDLGQTCIFAFFTATTGMAGKHHYRMAEFIQLWDSALINGQLALIVAVGNLLGSPFELVFVRESISSKEWENPEIRELIIDECTTRSNKWLLLFVAMLAVTLPEPIDALMSHPFHISKVITFWFTNVAQAVIFVVGLLKLLWWDQFAPSYAPVECEPIPGQLPPAALPQAATIMRKVSWNDHSYGADRKSVV